jgi:hypothetical protein
VALPGLRRVRAVSPGHSRNPIPAGRSMRMRSLVRQPRIRVRVRASYRQSHATPCPDQRECRRRELLRTPRPRVSLSSQRPRICQRRSPRLAASGPDPASGAAALQPRGDHPRQDLTTPDHARGSGIGRGSDSLTCTVAAGGLREAKQHAMPTERSPRYSALGASAAPAGSNHHGHAHASWPAAWSTQPRSSRPPTTVSAQQPTPTARATSPACAMQVGDCRCDQR